MTKIKFFDDRRDIVIPGNHEETLKFAAAHFVSQSNEAVKAHGNFFVALSGGSTPKKIYEKVCAPPLQKEMPWNKINLFWSDERSVPSSHPDSNFHMAMEAGFAKMSIPPENIHRMEAEGDIEAGALAYEELLKEKKASPLDLVLLGMGDDGHTASLFPKTHGLHTQTRLCIANFIPQKDTWRLTLTFECINEAKLSVIYVLGAGKTEMVKKVLTGPYNPDVLPIQRIGTREHKALWILDEEAGSLL
jgi:6-phosphogluconolactonase